MSCSDWIEFGVGVITLLGIIVSAIISVRAINKSTNENRKSIKAQWDLYNRQKGDEEQKGLHDKIKAAHAIINIVPSIILEGFIICNKRNDSGNQYMRVKDAGTIFTDYDFVNGMNVLNDVLSKDEMLFLFRLSALINKLKVLLARQVNVTLADKDKYVYKLAYNAYQQLIIAFCDGFSHCNEQYHCSNMDKEIIPFGEIMNHAPDNVTIDFILEKSNSYFSHKFRDNQDDIYTKLLKIVEDNQNG